jgi:putative transcriptional regulator
MILYNNIRKHRYQHGEMTQKELAGQVGVSRQTINAIEIAIRIAGVFREDLSDILIYDYDGKPDFMIVTVQLGNDSDP